MYRTHSLHRAGVMWTEIACQFICVDANSNAIALSLALDF